MSKIIRGNWRSGSSLIAFCVLALQAEVSMAQEAVEAESPAPQTIDDGVITVTAQRRAQKITDVPMTITAHSGEDLLAAGISKPEDLAKIVPGLVYSKSAYGSPIYTLRGVGFYDYTLAATPTVTVYVDEVPLPYSRMTQFAGLDVERVEVLKGPQGTLYGENATGGAINYLAAKPTSDFRAGFDASYGRFSSVDLQGFVSGPVSETLKMRIAARYEGGNGWQYSYTRPGDRLGSKEIVNGRVILQWDPTSQFSATLNLNAGVDRSEVQAAQFQGITISNPANTTVRNVLPNLFNYPVAPRDNRAVDWNTDLSLRQHNTQIQSALTLKYELSPAINLTSISSYSRFRERQPVEADGTIFQDMNGIARGQISSLYQEIRAQVKLSSDMALILGGNIQRDRISESLSSFNRDSVNGLIGADFNTTRTRQPVDTQSVYANMDYALSDNLSLQAGIRYTDQTHRFEGCTIADTARFAAFLSTATGTQVLVGNCGTKLPDGTTGTPYKATLSEDNIAWRGTLSWKPSQDAMVYATVSKGYKGGSFPLAGAVSFTSFRPVVQESLLDIEGGFKVSLADRMLQINAAAFYYDYTNKQLRGKVIDPLTQLAFGAITTVPKSELYGAELQVTVRPVEGLTFDVQGTYVHSRIIGPFVNFDFFGIRKDFDQEPLPFSPEWSGVARVDYTRPISSKLRAFAAADLHYQSSSNASLGQQPQFELRGYKTLDLRAGVATLDEKTTFSLWGRNVTNTYYWTSALLVIDVVSRYAGAPASYGASVSYRF